MSFSVESENLRRQAGLWADRKADARSVKTTISVGFGQGSAFGFMAGGEGVKDMYDEWTSDMENCLTDAAYSFSYLDNALRSTAAEYDESDATARQSAEALDKLLDEGKYHHD